MTSRVFLRFALCLATFSVFSRSQQSSIDTTPPYRNAKLCIEDRVADLLSRMTLEEKVEQLAGGELHIHFHAQGS